MTIAACYMSPEGVVLGADSTTTASGGDLSGNHYFNFNQKIFEVGENSSLGVLTWGLGSLGTKSHRSLFADLDDSLRATPAVAVADVAQRLADLAWNDYTSAWAGPIQRCKDLNAKPAFDQTKVPPAPNSRTKDEEEEFGILRRNLVLGFCVAGYCPPDRNIGAYEIVLDSLAGKPTPTNKSAIGSYSYWGAPNVVRRLIFGADESVRNDVLSSGKWSGTPAELDALLAKQQWGHPMLPIRDAVDFVHTCIYSTIKGLKFSSLPQICGGPIEIAVITTDRRFRWVRHKAWDAAIIEG